VWCNDAERGPRLATGREKRKRPGPRSGRTEGHRSYGCAPTQWIVGDRFSSGSRRTATRRLRQTGLRRPRRPSDELVGDGQSRDAVRPWAPPLGPCDARRSGTHRHRRQHQKARRTQHALRHDAVLGRPRPYRRISVVNAGRVADLLVPLSFLRFPVMDPVKARPGHSPNGERQEQEARQNGTALGHRPGWRQCKSAGPIATRAPWFPR